MKKYILSIDQSTSASKVMVINQDAQLVDRITLPHQQYYPEKGMVEHDPQEIFENVSKGIKDVISRLDLSAGSIVALAITNQRETAMIWDRKTGKPIGNAAVWQCQRGLEWCNKLKESGMEKTIREKTGLIIDPYFSAGKLHWMMNNIDGLKQKAAQGELALGTMDSWLIWKLTGGKVHATDHSNACRTMLFNINTLRWDNDILHLADLHPSMLPHVKPSDSIFGYTAVDFNTGSIIPITGVLGDSHAALFGQNCFHPGMAKATYGTGSSIMMNIGNKPRIAPHGLVTSIGYARNGTIDYVFEGNIHCTGDTINWLKNEIQLISSAEEAEQLAISVNENKGVYLVPAFVGLGAPYWDNEARAAITGMGRDTTRAHIARAALESIAYQIKDLTDLMQNAAGISIEELRVDGGPTRNNFLMQFQSDLIQTSVVRCTIEEISALGSTFMAGLATGVWNNITEIEKLRKEDQSFEPFMDFHEAQKLYDGWKKAVNQVRYNKTDI